MGEKEQNDVRKAPIGQHLGEHGSAALSALISSERKLRNDEYLYRSGDAAQNFYMVASGRMALCVEDPQIKRNRIIHVVKVGDLIGELDCIVGEPYQISVQSIGESSAYVFDYQKVEELYSKEPEVMFSFLKAIIRRIHHTASAINQQRDDLANYLATGGKGKY